MEHGPCSVAGGGQGTQEASCLAPDPRRNSPPGWGCCAPSSLRGVSRRILRVTEASEREGGERIARLGKEGRTGGQGALHLLEAWWELFEGHKREQ